MSDEISEREDLGGESTDEAPPATPCFRVVQSAALQRSSGFSTGFPPTMRRRSTAVSMHSGVARSGLRIMSWPSAITNGVTLYEK